VNQFIEGIKVMFGGKSHRGPPAIDKRMYQSAIPNRINRGFPGFNSSADHELVTSLRNLRSRSRQLVRDAAYAKSAKRTIVNNVIGTGIRLQGLVQNARGELNERMNDAIESAWRKWSEADSCHTGGEVHFSDMERMMMGQVFEAGEIFIRVHRQKFGKSAVPIGLEVVEPERIVDGYAAPSAILPGGQIRMGIEVDQFRRPIAYWIRDLHPGDIRLNAEKTDRATRVLASDVYHLRIIDRWPQTRGEPWMHAVARKLQDMDGYSEAEIIAARGAASYLGTIETPEDPNTLGQEQPDGSTQMGIEAGSWLRLQPGEKANFVAPNRPNAALDPFMRFMLREFAAGTGISYEALSSDFSQTNYSSSRLSLLTERDVWKALQAWFIRSFRTRFHRDWLQTAVMAGAIPELPVGMYGADIVKYEAAIFRPRGWSWVDPTKEVAAYKEAVKAGFTTVGAVIGQTSGGEDLEDVISTRRDELSYMKSEALVFDTSPAVYIPADTRGLMVEGGPTGVEPAAVLLPVAGAPGTPVAAKPATDEPAPTPPESDNEPVGAEEEEDRRIVQLVRRRSL
jgi:lambda family phage portal protein